MKRFAIGLMLLTMTACQRLEPGVHPSPVLAPADVVAAQLEALRNPDIPRPNAGIWTVFEFASPSNKRVTGPYGRFLEMIKSAPNRPLHYAKSFRLGPVQQIREQAEVPVEITSNSGLISAWTFSLSRQTAGDCAGCWMTDLVRRTR